MKRRSLLKAAGLAAIVDVERVAADSGDTAAGDEPPGDRATAGAAGSPQRFVRRLPAPTAGEGGLLASLARGPALDARAAAPLLAGAAAVGSVVGPDAALTVGWGGRSRADAVADLQAEGFERAHEVAGSEAFARTSRGRVRVVVPLEDVTAVGRGAEYGPVVDLLSTVLSPDRDTASEDHGRAAAADTRQADLGTVADLLGDGVATAVEVPRPQPEVADGGAPSAGKGPRPTAVGERVATADDGGVTVRRVAVYPTREASLRARESDWGPWPGEDTVERTGVSRRGRAVVRNAVADDPAVVLDPGA